MQNYEVGEKVEAAWDIELGVSRVYQGATGTVDFVTDTSFHVLWHKRHSSGTKMGTWHSFGAPCISQTRNRSSLISKG